MIWFARILSFSVGFLSLSQEILWVRLVSFATGGLPQAFGYVLGSFLVGIALGAIVGKRCCERSRDLLQVAGMVLVLAGLIDLALPWLAIQSLDAPRPAHLLGLAFFIATSAFLKSILFPIAHHLGTVIDGDKVGVSVSRVYFANILGATTGPLITGLLLLQWMSLQANFVAVGLLTALAGLACLARSSWNPAKLLLPAAPVAAVAVLALQFPLVANLIQREHPERGPINFVLQNRYGIVHTREGKQGGDWVYGGNTYDGRVNTDLLVDSNGIRRVYLLAALHPQPQNVLQIGLGSGSWMEVLAGFSGLKSLDVVEINPGYAELVERYPGVRAAEALPEVHINWDDGRKWLDQHPERRFDLIVVNTTFYWRAYTTMLLSKEFMSLARSRLAPGGILAFNSTGSADAFATARAVFPNVYSSETFVIASDRPLAVDVGTAIDRLADIRLPTGERLDVSDPRMVQKIASMVARFQPYAPTATEAANSTIITDQNMVTEYRHGTRLRWWH
jgi:spermidine synthase